MKNTTNYSEEDQKRLDDFFNKEIEKGDLNAEFAKFREEIRKLKPVEDD